MRDFRLSFVAALSHLRQKVQDWQQDTIQVLDVHESSVPTLLVHNLPAGPSAPDLVNSNCHLYGWLSLAGRVPRPG